MRIEVRRSPATYKRRLALYDRVKNAFVRHPWTNAMLTYNRMESALRAAHRHLAKEKPS